MFPTDLTEEYQRKHPLHASLLLDDLTKLEEVISQGYCPNERDDRGRTALHFTIEHAKTVDQLVNTCKYLLDNNAWINYYDFDGRTPLHCMYDSCVRKATKDDGRLLDLFLKRGADIEILSNYGQTPLYMAVDANNVQAARKLLQSGAQLDCGRRDSVFTRACENENLEMIQMLLTFDVNIDNAQALSAAVHSDKPEMLRLIIEYGVRRTEKDDHVVNCLRYLIDSVLSLRNPDLIEALVENEYRRMIITESTEDLVTSKASILEKAYNFEHQEFESDPFYAKEFLKRERTIQVLLKHVAIVQELDNTVTIGDSTMKFIRANSLLDEQLDKYVKQIRTMKTTCVREDLRVTYYDLLTSCGKTLMRYCDDESCKIVSNNANILYPDFSDRLLRNVRRGLFEKKTRDAAMQFLRRVLKSFLPIELMRYICDQLEMRDLKTFIVTPDVWLQRYF